jgi:poly(3-hydroxyoctanoate) depolymerase
VADTRYVDADGVRLRTSIRGVGRPRLLITWIGASLSRSAPLEDALNAHGVQTIAADAPGTGKSTRYRRQRPPPVLDTIDQQLASLDAETRVTVQLHPVSPLGLGL